VNQLVQKAVMQLQQRFNMSAQSCFQLDDLTSFDQCAANLVIKKEDSEKEFALLQQFAFNRLQICVEAGLKEDKCLADTASIITKGLDNIQANI